MIPTTLQRSGAFVLRKFQTAFGAAPLIGANASARASGFVRPSLFITVLVFAAIIALPMLMLGALAFGLHAHPLAIGALTAFAAPATTKEKPIAIKREEAELRVLLKELEVGQAEMAAGPISQSRGEELESKAKEAEAKQARIDQYNRIAGVVDTGRQVGSVTLPTDSRGNIRRVKTTPGHLFVMSDAFANYRHQGKQGQSAWVEIKSRLGRPVVLTGEQAVALEAKAFSSGQLSDLGTDAVIQVDRDPEIVRFEEPEMLTIRDVMNVVPTTSDSVEYVRQTAVTRAAAVQATRGAAKSYLTVTFDKQTVSTTTIAVLSKVTEQDIDDAPRLVGVINGEMSLDVKVKEEQQLLWGAGSGGEIKGLFHEDNAVPEFDRAVGGDTVIDTIRRIRTDLRKKQVTPNFVTVDPVDWEEIELTKGTDERYVWGLITDVRGPRIWSLRVIESDAMTNATNSQRRVLVGDGIRGATIYDRHDLRLAIGFVDDDFARNLRTLRAEERLALAVKRPWAFEFAVTAAAES